MPKTTTLNSILEWLEQMGLAGVVIEQKEELLVLKLSEGDRTRLLGDEDFRNKVIAQAKPLGFTRVALDLG